MSFEKGSILYNVGALYTQIGARQDRTTAEGIATAEENFLKAAGTFHYLRENFSNAPSMDMQTPTLEMLVQLMLAQAQECVFEKLTLNGVESGMEKHTATAQDAAKVSVTHESPHLPCHFHSSIKAFPTNWDFANKRNGNRCLWRETHKDLQHPGLMVVTQCNLLSRYKLTSYVWDTVSLFCASVCCRWLRCTASRTA